MLNQPLPPMYSLFDLSFASILSRVHAATRRTAEQLVPSTAITAREIYHRLARCCNPAAVA